MARRYPLWIVLLLILAVGTLAVYWLGKGPDTPQWQLARAARRELRIVVSTNGIIEPAERNGIYAPIDAQVAQVAVEEGTDIVRGQLLVRLEAEQIRTALANARAALLGQKRQAWTVLTGPSGEERAELEASIAECGMQLKQVDKELKEEESLYAKGAVPRAAVENLRKQRDLLEKETKGAGTALLARRTGMGTGQGGGAGPAGGAVGTAAADGIRYRTC